jgi:uncharacterized membrane protein
MSSSRPSKTQERIRRTFVAGIFAFVPLAVTAFVIYWIDDKVRGLFTYLWTLISPNGARPHIPLIGTIPFVGVVITLAVIYVTGMITTSVIGKYLLQLVDWLLVRLPVIRPIYQAWKQIALTPGGTEGMFAKVCLVPDETAQMRLLAFSNGRLVEGDEPMYCVFVPSSPNPIMGRLYFVPADKCQFLAMTAEEAFKIVLSTGNYVPPLVISAPKAPVKA